MPKELIFFLCACCILFLTVINLSVGFVVSGRGGEWGTLSCAYYEDDYDIHKNGLSDKEKKYKHEWKINECKRKKGFHDMEYTAFIFDIVIGFVCGLLGLLHLFDVKIAVSKIGIIGLICGIIGFILTFVYVVFNGIVFTNYNIDYFVDMENGVNNELYKRDSDGAYAEWDEGKSKYKCIYFDFDEPLNKFELYAKFSDLIQKQYNYDKDYYFESSKEVEGCQKDQVCDSDGYINNGGTKYTYTDNGSKDCNKLYIEKEYVEDVLNKDYFDRFLTTLILSLIVCIGNIGLAIFGFLLFKSPADSTKVIAVEN